MYRLELFHDNLSPNAKAALQAQHSIIYDLKGSVTINGVGVPADSAVYAGDVAVIEACAEGATLWRWELVREADPLHLLGGRGVTSSVRMAREIKMFELVPTSKWLFRLDIIREAEGSTGLHCHPGSGIRCLLSGEFRVESQKGESSESRSPGDAWYEEGAYPLVSTAPPGVKTTFLRGMVLPPEFLNYGETATWIEHKPTKTLTAAGEPREAICSAGHYFAVGQLPPIRVHCDALRSTCWKAGRQRSPGFNMRVVGGGPS